MAVKRVLLIVLDGWGVNMNKDGNAIAAAKAPVYERLIADYPHAELEASGGAVGLPDGQMGNSEVGHLNLGAGRVVYQDFTRINLAIEQGPFFENPVLVETFDRVKGTGAALHLIGLLSDGGVHSHRDHLYALLELARRKDLGRIFVHAF